MEVVSRSLAHHRLYDDAKRLLKIRFVTGHDFSRAPVKLKQTSETQRRTTSLHAPLAMRLWHLASLDAPTVALVWSVAFAWTANVHLPWWVLVLLPLGVWTVYIADRLLDARTGIQPFARAKLHERHIFHWRHRRILAPIALASAVVAAWIIFHLMPSTTREHDSLLAAASLLYFTQVHSGRRLLSVPSKELLVGIIFTFGCALPAFSRAHLSFAWWPLVIATVFFALLAWLNCFAIDRWESRKANSAGHSISLSALLLAAACLICSALLAVSHPRSASLLASAAAAALMLAALDLVRGRLTPITLRVAADLALLTPAMLLVLAPLLRQ
jgi:hypothetical protein